MGKILDSYTAVTIIPYKKYRKSCAFWGALPDVLLRSSCHNFFQFSLKISVSEELYSGTNGPVVCTECSNVLEIRKVMYV
jgi:hypothetical protein